MAPESTDSVSVVSCAGEMDSEGLAVLILMPRVAGDDFRWMDATPIAAQG